MNHARVQATTLDQVFDEAYYALRSSGFAAGYSLRMGQPDEQAIIIFTMKAGAKAQVVLDAMAAALLEWDEGGMIDVDDVFRSSVFEHGKGPV